MNLRRARKRHQDEALRLANAPTGQRRGVAKEAHRVRVIDKVMQLRKELRNAQR